MICKGKMECTEILYGLVCDLLQSLLKRYDVFVKGLIKYNEVDNNLISCRVWVVLKIKLSYIRKCLPNCSLLVY